MEPIQPPSFSQKISREEISQKKASEHYSFSKKDSLIQKTALSIWKKIALFFHKKAGKLIISSSSLEKRTSKAVKEFYQMSFHCEEDSRYSDLDDLRYMATIRAKDKKASVARMTIEYEGLEIDAFFIQREDAKDRRWLLYSGGNNELYEHTALSNNFYDLIESCESNAVLFNYPGCGNSSGSPTKADLQKAHKAILKYVEEHIQPKEIICYGQSIGGGIQLSSLKDHSFKEDINYLTVTSRSFSELTKVISDWIFKPLGWLAKTIGWKLDSIESLLKLKDQKNLSHIILQASESKQAIKLNPDQLHVEKGVVSQEKKDVDKEKVVLIAKKTDYAMQKSNLLKAVIQKEELKEDLQNHRIQLVALESQKDSHNGIIKRGSLDIIRGLIDEKFS